MKYIYVSILCIFFTLACSDVEDNAELPACADELLSLFMTENENCEDAQVAIYDFMGEQVNVFAQGICISDGSTSVFNQDCEEICYLGGIAGFEECNGFNFYDSAILVDVVWER